MTCQLQPFRVAPFLAPCCGVRGSIKLQPGGERITAQSTFISRRSRKPPLNKVRAHSLCRQHIVILDQNHIRLR